MGEILVAGITHYPPLAGRDETMAWILKRMLQNPHLAGEISRTSIGRRRCARNGATTKVRLPRECIASACSFAAKSSRGNRRVSSPTSSWCGATISMRIFARMCSAILHLCARFFRIRPAAAKMCGTNAPDRKFRARATSRPPNISPAVSSSRVSTPPTHTDHCIIRSATPLRTPCCTSTTIERAFRIPSFHSRLIAMAAG